MCWSKGHVHWVWRHGVLGWSIWWVEGQFSGDISQAMFIFEAILRHYRIGGQLGLWGRLESSCLEAGSGYNEIRGMKRVMPAAFALYTHYPALCVSFGPRRAGCRDWKGPACGHWKRRGDLDTCVYRSLHCPDGVGWDGVQIDSFQFLRGFIIQSINHHHKLIQPAEEVDASSDILIAIPRHHRRA